PPQISTTCITTSPMKLTYVAESARPWRRCRLRSSRSSLASRAEHRTSSTFPTRGWWRWASASKFDFAPARPDRRRILCALPLHPLSLAGGAAEMLDLAGNRCRGHQSVMAQEPKQTAPGLDAIAGVAREASRKGAPPVHLWNPPFCGDLDMRIAGDGTWFYLKTPIGRPALVKLFASVLKREGDKYFLVTPVEKCGIVVEDAPFLAVELKVEHDGGGQLLHFRTNVDDWVACGREHALRFEPEVET